MEQDTIRTLADLLSFSKIFASAVVVVLAWLSLKVLYSLIWVLTARFSRYRLQITRFTPVVRLLVWTSAAYIIVVYIFQPKTNAILALAASFGIALGLALQDLVKNLISGILILVDQPFRVGDMIEVDGHYGEVVNIGLRSTRIHTFDDSIVTV
ncbi:MAG: mechanosensitive ion channel, partial [Acidobacteriota bacterium]